MIDSAITASPDSRPVAYSARGASAQSSVAVRPLHPGPPRRITWHALCGALTNVLPTSDAPSWRLVSRLSAALVVLGLFTASWERAGNVGVGPYNIKLPALLLSLGVVAGIPLVARARGLVRSRVSRVMLVLTIACVGVLFARALFSADLHAAVPQAAAILSGAILPAFAVVLHASSRRDVVLLLRWFIAGGLAASLFGLYQLAAFYLHLPQGIPYTGLGTDGITGRIASLSYEPAYFGYYLALVIGALLAHEMLSGRRTPWYLLVGISLTIALVNARAMLFIGPLLIVLLAFRFRRYRRSWIILAVSAVAGVVLCTSMPTIVYSMERGAESRSTADGSAQSAAPSAPAASAVPTSETVRVPGASGGPAASATPIAPASAPASTPPAVVQPERPHSTALLDPREQSSNAPRLSLIALAVKVVRQNPILGVGIGNLQHALRSERADGLDLDLSRPIVANNVWLQALLDGGVLALLLELGIAVVVGVVFCLKRYSAVSPLAASWLAVMAVGGMLTSYFFALEMWVVLGLLLATIPLLRRSDAIDGRSAS